MAKKSKLNQLETFKQKGRTEGKFSMWNDGHSRRRLLGLVLEMVHIIWGYQKYINEFYFRVTGGLLGFNAIKSLRKILWGSTKD